VYRAPKSEGGWTKTFLVRGWDDAKQEVGRLRAERAAVVPASVTPTTTDVPARKLVWSYSVAVARFIAACRARGRARSYTIDGYERDFEKRFDPYFKETRGDVALTDITGADVIAALERLHGPMKDANPRNWNKDATLLHMCFRYAARQHRESGLVVSPINEDHRKSEKQARRDRHRALAGAIPTAEQVTAFEKAALAVEDGTSVGLVLFLCLRLGLRIEEALHLLVGNVTFEKGYADIFVASGRPCDCDRCAARGGTWRTKTDAERYVPILPDVAELLRQHIRELRALGLGEPDSLLLPVLHRRSRSAAPSGKKITYQVVKKRLPKLYEAAKINPPERYAAHFLRHVARSTWSAAGLTSEQINLAIGHGIEGVEGGYTHQRRQEQYEAFLDKLGPAISRRRRHKAAARAVTTTGTEAGQICLT